MITDGPSRGVRLWRDLHGDAQAPELRILLEEACRIVDRLDKLDALLDGSAEDWIRLQEVQGDPERTIVVIDKPLAEARQQAVALKQILTELRTAGLVGKSGRGEATGVTDIASWAPARSTKATS